MELTKAEEALMKLVWKHRKVYMKDLLAAYPDPKPAKTTIATLLKRLQEKEFVGYTLHGNSREYYPLVEKKVYFSSHIGGLIRNFFDNSSLKFASFFTQNSKLSYEELEALRNMVDEEMEKTKKS
ncbi:MAG TPA: penicillinase repressor [Cytophagales bacterium]|nr:penicillinase repressor [Cytophagales bacterium]HAA21770.1 penicillinase repressor [Cytophagales bacterium]HAP60070.1 penicillinase repressor [Cytophagales bacterium]